MSLSEFELIQRYFAEASTDASVALGIGDDCAVLSVPTGQQLAVSIDSLVQGTHFLEGTPADLLASRLFGSALSDLAAMGATPAWLTLALTLPESDEDWLQLFSSRLAQLCNEYHVSLVGGDTTKGPLTLSAQVHGFLPCDHRLTRAGAKVGDLICVSGCLGDSRGGLDGLLNGFDNLAEAGYLLERFYAPTPRIELGKILLGKANSCIDISDGLLSDLSHILKASGGLGARLQLEAVPISSQLIATFGEESARQWALTGGEDFELCFTLPPNYLALLSQLPVPVAVIGKVTDRADIELFLRGEPCQIQGSGYDHFQRTDD